MLTLKIDNPEIEHFIKKRYDIDTQSLLQDFAAFVKVSMSDGYPAISTDEAKRRVAKALQEIEEGTAVMLSQEAYDKEMKQFMQSL